MLTLALISFWLLMGIIAAQVAEKRGRDKLSWFFIGTLFGLLGILLLFILPSSVKKGEKESLGPDKPEVKHLEHASHAWYYLDRNHQTQGPLPFSLLKEKWEESEIVFDTFVWREGMSDWQTIEGTEGLAEALDFE